jgi:hypothetical protein
MADEDKAQRETVKAMPKQTFVKPSAEQLAGWKTKIQPAITAWTKTAPNNDAVLAKFKEELANAGH